MKILRISSDLYPGVVGGLGIHAHNLSISQAELGNEVTVLTNSLISKDLCSSTPYEIIQFPTKVQVLGNSISPSICNYIFKERKNFDIIHAHSHLFFSTNCTALAKKMGSSPLIITNHGIYSQSVPMGIQRLSMKTFWRWTLNSADRIICYTYEEKRNLIRNGITGSKIEVIHNGIDINLFSPGKKEPRNQILWVGRYTPGKSVEYLIRAFEIVNEKFPNTKLVMIGDGPLKKSIEKMIRIKNLQNNVIMKNNISNLEIYQEYQHSKIFALSSIEEGVPRTILEALSCEVPVVCSDLPQLRGIVKGNGLLVEPRNSDEFAQSLMSLLTDNKMSREFGEEGRNKIVKNYSWNDTVEKTMELYENAL